MRERTLVVMLTYNERENLEGIASAVLAVDPSLDLLVVDDSSPDGTGVLADALAAAEPRLRVLHRDVKQGIGPAYVAGFRWALEHDYGRVVQMDADFSHRPEDLPKLLAAAEGADVVVGSRRVEGGAVTDWSLLRRAVSSFGSVYARFLLRLPVHDCTSGFKVIRREALEAIDLAQMHANGYSFQIELLDAWFRTGLRIVEVPIVFPDRAAGRSKMSIRIAAEAALVVLAFRFGVLRPAGAQARRKSRSSTS
jgi:dolichol-phosphate mannosyltransferase